MVCWSAISHTSHSPYISLGPVRTLFGWIDQWIGNVARWQTSTASPVARSWVMYFVLLGHYITFITFIRKYHTFPSEFSQKMKMMKDILNLLESFAIGSNLSPEPNWADFHRFPMSCRWRLFPEFSQHRASWLRYASLRLQSARAHAQLRTGAADPRCDLGVHC